MSAHGPLAHHFDTMEQQHEAATLGMWLFLGTEVMFFGGLFAAYTIYRWLYPEAWAEGSLHMDVTLGTINTAVLLTSSLTVALAVHSAQAGHAGRIAPYILATIVLGAAFLGIKAYEYWHHIHEGLLPGANFNLHSLKNADVDPRNVSLFMAFYFVMTGLHATHMVIGLALWGVLAFQARRGMFSAAYNAPVENMGLYWHFVDVVWVFLFPLLYLIAAPQ